MASHSEAQTQLARLLGDQTLRLADAEAVRAAIENGFHRLSQGLLAEAADSDDVIDPESAVAFLQDRLDFLGALLDDRQRTRLLEVLRVKIEAW